MCCLILAFFPFLVKPSYGIEARPVLGWSQEAMLSYKNLITDCILSIGDHLPVYLCVGVSGVKFHINTLYPEIMQLNVASALPTGPGAGGKAEH